MISRWKVALISSAALLLALCGTCEAGLIGSVSYRGASAVSAQMLGQRSLLRTGAVYSDSLVSMEVIRIDSLYFSNGYLGVDVRPDTSVSGRGIDVTFAIAEGEATHVGKISVSGADFIGEAAAESRVRPRAGDQFDPFSLERSLRELLAIYNESGYPYAQVWLTGFEYRPEANEVDINVSISEGTHSALGRIVFEGLARTDSSVALRTSRLKTGAAYNEKRIAGARLYLEGSGYFQSVGDPRIEMRSRGTVDVVFPVKEIERGNFFQGALGFSRTEQGTYVLNGSIALELKNIAGTGRGVRFDWLNDGRDYSRLALKFREPFLFRSPVRLDGELSQVIQDTVYMWNSGALYFSYPIGPLTSLVAGAAADRNVPNTGELIRSIRERFRFGLTRTAGGGGALDAYVEGAYRKSYLRGGRAERDAELLYRIDGTVSAPSWNDQSVSVRLVSEAVFSTGDVPLAELFPLGGATTLRGYRESQFRGERVAFTNLEYRFGEGGWLFLFDDAGAFYRRDEGWTVKNGVGFGLRSESPLGIVVLSFGVGEQLSLEGTRIHISLVERF
jgi:outer membrane protein insertion porin family